MANWLTTYLRMFSGASWRSGSSAGRWTHFWMTALSARFAFVLRSSELASWRKTASSLCVKIQMKLEKKKLQTLNKVQEDLLLTRVKKK